MMFKNEYQGGPAVEIFSAQGKDPVAKWKLSGGQSAINKEFDKEVKSFVLSLEGSSQTIKMQMPKDGKMSLGLVQRFLVLQVNVSQCKDFSAELVITDLSHLKRRLYLSTVHKEFFATPLHARIPFVGLKRNVWCNMCIDLVSFTGELFKGAGFLSLDGITVSASCKLRRIFTMKSEPAGTCDGNMFICGNSPMDSIPRSCQFPSDVQHVTQVLNIERLRWADLKTGYVNPDLDLSSPSRAHSAVRGPKVQQDASHIAFGSRVSGPPPLTLRRNGGASEEQDGRIRDGRTQDGRTQDDVRTQDGRTQDGRTQWSMNKGSVSGARTKSTASGERQDHADQSKEQPVPSGQKNEYLTELAGKAGSLQPRPPAHRGASESGSSRKFRIHSAGKERPAPASGQEDSGRLQHGDRSESIERAAFPSSQMSGNQPADTVLSPRATDEDRDVLNASKTSPEPPSGPDFPPSPLPLQDTDSDRSEGLTDGEDDSEPQLSVEDVFMFSSRPHSARRGQESGRSIQGYVEACRTNEAAHGPNTHSQPDTGARSGARPEDDFLASESEEDDTTSRFLFQRNMVSVGPGSLADPPSCSPGITGSSGPDGDRPTRVEPGRRVTMEPTLSCTDAEQDQTRQTPHIDYHAYSRIAEVAGLIPNRCLSPTRGSRQELVQEHRKPSRSGPGGALGAGAVWRDRSSWTTSLSTSSLREIYPPRDPRLDQVGEVRRHEPVESSGSCWDLPLDSLCMQENEEVEQRMLASLRREQEEEDEGGGATGLSDSQILHCNVSISTSSEDTTTWTPLPANQGHHYQKEMNPLLHSNPREWMDVLSPPIIPPRQKKGQRSEDTADQPIGHIPRAAGESVPGGDEEYLNLLYDPCLNCYFEPQSGKYYELA
ncbi:hypothetical protein UPYG_G00166590 [Umbra pygmaea]|uniref:CFA20 domain-containing protein n=1 Tax=Umbra pygmaea TaxID=75934 RepID=A0ABD0WMN2_UMBPY